MEGLIYKAIPDIMADIGAIAKGRNNAQQGYAYRGIEDFYNAIHPLMTKHRVFSVPEVVHKEREERLSKSGNALIYTMLTVKYTFFAEDGSSVSAIVTGEGMDSGDKSANKALSVAHKYALAQIFCVPTAELVDPETDSPEVKPKPPVPPADTAFLRDGLLSLLNMVEDTVGKPKADALREAIKSGKHDGDVAWYEKALAATKAKVQEQEALLAANTTKPANPLEKALDTLGASVGAKSGEKATKPGELTLEQRGISDHD